MTLTEPLFSEIDKQLINALVFDSSLEPMFNSLADYFFWFDERPKNITPDASDKLQSLWVGRSLLHKGLTFADHEINPEYCANIWKQQMKIALKTIS